MDYQNVTTQGSGDNSPHGKAVWSNPGTYSWIVPNGIKSTTQLWVTISGGGGGGGDYSGGGGGGAAAQASYPISGLTSGQVVTLGVGTGGLRGLAGEGSYFGSFITCDGGKPGGSYGHGDINNGGLAGGLGGSNGAAGGGGYNSGAHHAGGTGGSSILGVGGAGGSGGGYGNFNGQRGSGYGSGGGGGNQFGIGGSGSGGIIIVEW